MTGPGPREIGYETYAAWFSSNRDQLMRRGPFHDPAWLQAVSRGTGFDLAFIGAFDGEDLTTVVPGFLTRRGPFRLFGSPLRGTMTSYLGPVSLDPRSADDERQRQLIFATTRFAMKRWRLSYARTTVRDASAERADLPGADWREQRSKSYRLALSPGEDALLGAVKPHCRRNIRKAAREGVEIVPLDDAGVFFQLLEGTLRRHGSSSWQTKTFFDLLMRELPPRGLMWTWGARYDERIIAAGLFLHDETEVHFISGASLQEYGSLPTSYLLHWHAIATAAKEGLRVFNSEASGIPSIDQFKETFNPTLERRASYLWESPSASSAERVFRWADRRARHIQSRLPAGRAADRAAR